VRAIVGRIGEIEFGLNVDFHPLSLALPLHGTSARAHFRFAQYILIFIDRDFFVEREAGLNVVRTRDAAADAVIFQAASDFAAPIGFGRRWFHCNTRVDSAPGGNARGSNCGDGNRFPHLAVWNERGIAEGANLGVLKQQGATLRAYVYHWCVLRRGGSSDGTKGIIARGEMWKRGARDWNGAYEATRETGADSHAEADCGHAVCVLG
jgi:hypothetical protein